MDYVERYMHIELGTYHSTPCIFDTGASSGLIPFRADFLDYSPVELEVKGVSGNGRVTVTGRGPVLRRFITRDGEVIFVPSMTYHMPGAEICLTIRRISRGG